MTMAASSGGLQPRRWSTAADLWPAPALGSGGEVQGPLLVRAPLFSIRMVPSRAVPQA